MKLMITIPDEFKTDFNKDHFAGCFGRVLADISGYSGLCGNYEQETVEMLAAVFKDAKEISSVNLAKSEQKILGSIDLSREAAAQEQDELELD